MRTTGKNFINTLSRVFASVGFLVLLLSTTSSEALEAPKINPRTTSGLQTFYQALNYDWVELDQGVPPFILESMPGDINHAVGIKEKKKTFFMGLLPMVLLANREILDERSEILDIIDRHTSRTATNDDKNRISEIAKRYGLRGKPLTDHRARTLLLKRVDIIPPSLALAQAANESAWGTSRFARLGNNIFGEWTYKPGTGIVPQGRPEGATYEVRKFKSIYRSIRSYMNNLNSNGAYSKLQNIRAELRNADRPITGMALAAGLLRYSQRGEAYIKEIQDMIRHNKLERVNSASLRMPKDEAAPLTSITTTGAGLFSSRNRIIGHRPATSRNP